MAIKAESPYMVQLQPETVEGFEEYVRSAESGMERMRGEAFLWSDGNAERARRVAQGEIVTGLWSGREPVAVPRGLIHDWIGAMFVAGATVKKTLALVQDYDNHKHIYLAEVLDSRLMRRHGNDFKIYLRLLKKKILTVVLDTDHDVHYEALDHTRWFCRSSTTRISEVEDAGRPNEQVLPPGTGFGFLWRLNSYWGFEERDGGVYVECRAISLTRDIPAVFRWIIQPIVRNLPRESLITTLRETREGLGRKSEVRSQKSE